MALFLMAWLTPRRVAMVALAGSVVPVGVNFYLVSSLPNWNQPTLLVLNTILWVLPMLASWFAGRALARGERRLVTQRDWAKDAQAEALVAERLRISREIHDTVAHSLTGIVLQAAGARAGLSRGGASKEELEEALGSIQSAAEQSMRELHRLLGMLRESEDAELKAVGVGQLGELVDSARTAGLDVIFEISGEPVELDPSISHTVYRVVQEGLSNVMKHAGSGARVTVVLDWMPQNLAITVRNTSGLGSSKAPSGGFGLVGLRERVSVSGGSLEAGPTADGYLLHAHLPAQRPRALVPRVS
ncbi:sensor histidine kinase [Tessaracoccus caeni]|uniref:sensor histidine kinase n=1 Tax=Tessaracoccus caeni TaxID=3031239 RepID=UPI0023D9B481|nr:histidine kinase [Tessaracoccus caeni]MDF1487409.1 histidine kinase [Tessaracoccus caeni]